LTSGLQNAFQGLATSNSSGNQAAANTATTQPASLASLTGGLQSAFQGLTPNSPSNPPASAATPQPAQANALGLDPSALAAPLQNLLGKSLGQNNMLDTLTQVIQLSEDVRKQNWVAVATDVSKLQPVRKLVPAQYLALLDAAVPVTQAMLKPGSSPGAVVASAGDAANNALTNLGTNTPSPQFDPSLAPSPDVQSNLNTQVDNALPQMVNQVQQNLQQNPQSPAAQQQLQILGQIPHLSPALQQQVVSLRKTYPKPKPNAAKQASQAKKQKAEKAAKPDS
jgi:hypothetical protein